MDDETELSTNRTNRPPLEELTSSFQSGNQELSTRNRSGAFGGRITQSLRKPLMSDTLTSTPMPYPTIQNESAAGKYSVGVSTPSSMSSPYSSRLKQSPPRIIPFSIPASQLEGTPIHIQAQMLTENTLRSVGVRSSDEEDDEFQINRAPVNSSGQKQSWDVSNMDRDDSESRANFEKFLEKRNQVQHVYKHPLDIPSSSMKRPREEENVQEEGSFKAPSIIEGSSFKAPSIIEGSRAPSVVDEEAGAYEFSGGLQQYKDDGINRGSMSGSSFSSLSPRDGRASVIPAQFNLQVFPEQFRTPPGSIKLTKVYDLFNQRPGAMLTVQDIMDYSNDESYSQVTVSLIISLLERKKFIKKVGKREAWVIRR